MVKGEQAVPADWDSFEVTRDFTEPVLTSELYEDIIDSVKWMRNWQANILYKIACAILQDYYTNALGMQAVGELFTSAITNALRGEKNRVLPNEKKQEIFRDAVRIFLAGQCEEKRCRKREGGQGTGGALRTALGGNDIL